MSQPSPETFCSAVNNAVCEDCPLSFVGEAEWSSVVRPGITPLILSETLPRVLREMVLEPTEVAAVQEQADPDPELVKAAVELGYDPDNTDTEYALQLLREDALDVPISVSEEEMRQGVLIRQLHDCVGRIANGNCVAYCPTAETQGVSPLAGALTLGLAGDTLSTVARFGSDQDVDKLAGRVLAWVEPYLDGPLPECAGNREILMAIAEVAKTMEENS